VIIEPFKPFHIDVLRAQGVQSAQLGEVSIVSGACASIAWPKGPAVTARDGDHILICGGIIEHTDKRGTCWALLSQQAAIHMLPITKAVKRFIDIHPWRRLEASVEERFGMGCKWVELLGFEFEGRMRAFGDDGETYLRYARVKL
jgi:hypothetical protein